MLASKLKCDTAQQQQHKKEFLFRLHQFYVLYGLYDPSLTLWSICVDEVYISSAKCVFFAWCLLCMENKPIWTFLHLHVDALQQYPWWRVRRGWGYKHMSYSYSTRGFFLCATPAALFWFTLILYSCPNLSLSSLVCSCKAGWDTVRQFRLTECCQRLW